MRYLSSVLLHFFFFNDTPTTEIYTLSLHDALPIYISMLKRRSQGICATGGGNLAWSAERSAQLQLTRTRSEEHTSELQSRQYLVCRLLLEKKKQKKTNRQTDAIKDDIHKEMNSHRL